MDVIGSVISVIDVAFVIGIIMMIQTLKKCFKINPKYLSSILILFGFLAAFIKVNPFAIREFIVQGFIYSAACELIYRRWKEIMKGDKK